MTDAPRSKGMATVGSVSQRQRSKSKGYAEICRELSRTLEQRARDAGVYDHPTAKGDSRERLLCEFLRERIGTDFGVSKVEIIDSDGTRSREHDLAIYDQAISSVLHVSGHRSIVRCESVAVVLEVKSELTASEATKSAAAFERALRLRRHFRATGWLQRISAESRGPVLDGFPCGEAFKEIPSVVTGLFAYRGPSVETATEYLRNGEIDFISVLGRYTISHQHRGEGHSARLPIVVKHAEGDGALAALHYVVEDSLQAFRASRLWVWPDSLRYLKTLEVPPRVRSRRQDVKRA